MGPLICQELGKAVSGGMGWALERAGEKSQRQSTEVIRSALEKYNQIRGIIWPGRRGSETEGKAKSLKVVCY